MSFATKMVAMLIGAFASLTLLVAAGAAQDQASPPAQDEAAAEDAPALPPEVTDPLIETEELTLRLVPLTKPELEAAAAAWLEIVQAKTHEVVEAQIEVVDEEGEAEETARQQLVDLTADRDALFDNYTVVVDSWEKKGGDPAAVADYRAYQNSILVEEVRTADFRTLMARAIEWATSSDGGIALAIKVGVIAASLLGLLFVAGIIRRIAGRGIRRIPNLSKLLQAFLIMVVYWITVAIGLMIVLSALGIDISPLFALIGGASFILAFALQGTLGNLASGLMIMINRPFDEGDYVDIGGVGGTVKSVSIVSTTVTTPDNQVIMIPNSNVWANVITNVTTSPTRRVDLVFGIGYGDSIEATQRVLEETVRAHPLVLAEPEPVVRVNELADSSVNLICRPWVKSGDYWTVYWDLMRQVKERFDAEGISIPFPQRDVHVHQEPGSSAGALAAR